ncbi:group II intron reverse transcriptase/maturase [Orientia tsutsugamushi]|uniref:group II intron reverse transcriptase/maturase n=2 Tax=Orientia tsutsugamushi TaxID=784 RepID=UPI00315D36E5
MLNANVTIETKDNFKKIYWHSIDWKEIIQKVNNLRRRIYRAAANGNTKLVRNLQRLMLRSRANRLLAIRRVTQINKGRKSPGVDKIVVNTDKERSLLMEKLADNNLSSVKPIKRVYIPKSNGKSRPLGLPTILDRCRQAVVKSALEPYLKAKFEGCSYGFRPGRSAHDAIQRISSIVRPGTTRNWILDADIKGAFDNIDHNFLLKIIGNFPARNWIQAWLKSGVMQDYQIIKTTAGTPQGGLISPLLLNITLHGMSDILNIIYNKCDHLHAKSEYALVRYADDFVICAKSESSCIRAKSIINDWLSIRGLELSKKKTRILHINEGFDFLGFNIRQYNTNSTRRGVALLVKPSKVSIKSFKKRISIEWKKSFSWNIDRIIDNLNSKIFGWCSYFNKVVSKKIFSNLDC